MIGVNELTRAPGASLGDAGKTPVARFTAIAPASPHSGLTGTLQGAGIARRAVRSQWVTLTDTYNVKHTQRNTSLVLT